MDFRLDGLLRRQLLVFASQPETTTEELLRRILDLAREISGADRGGALYLFDEVQGSGGAPRAAVTMGVLACRTSSPPPPAVEAARSAMPVRLAGSGALPEAASSL